MTSVTFEGICFVVSVLDHVYLYSRLLQHLHCTIFIDTYNYKCICVRTVDVCTLYLHVSITSLYIYVSVEAI